MLNHASRIPNPITARRSFYLSISLHWYRDLRVMKMPSSNKKSQVLRGRNKLLTSGGQSALFSSLGNLGALTRIFATYSKRDFNIHMIICYSYFFLSSSYYRYCQKDSFIQLETSFSPTFLGARRARSSDNLRALPSS